MSTGRLTRNGLVAIVAALVLALVADLLDLVVSLLLPSIPAADAAALRGVWIPLAAEGLDVAVVALGILGLLWLWQGRWEVGPEHGSRLWLAAMAFGVAAAGVAMRLGLGLLADVVFLNGVRTLFRTTLYGIDLGIALFTGLFLYWSVSGLRPFMGRSLGFVAIVLGVAGVALVQSPLIVSYRLLPPGVELGGLAAVVASLVIWIALYALGARRAKTLPARQAPATAA